MGIGPNGTNSVTMGGGTTPAVVNQVMRPKAPMATVAPPKPSKPLTTISPRNAAYGKAMANATKVTKLYK